MIDCDRESPKKTPLQMIWRKDLKCKVSAPEYVSQTIIISKYQPKDTFELIPLGSLTVRVLPPAAKLYLDQQEIKNPIRNLKVPPGSHTLKAVFHYQGRMIEQISEVEIKPKQRKTHIFDLTTELK